MSIGKGLRSVPDGAGLGFCCVSTVSPPHGQTCLTDVIARRWPPTVSAVAASLLLRLALASSGDIVVDPGPGPGPGPDPDPDQDQDQDQE